MHHKKPVSEGGMTKFEDAVFSHWKSERDKENDMHENIALIFSAAIPFTVLITCIYRQIDKFF